MKSKWMLITASILLAGCVKDNTKYNADGDAKGLAIFSNTGNNLFTCYVNGQPWRTINRTTAGLFSPARSELHMYKQADSSAADLLVIEWNGFFQVYPNSYNTIALYLKVPADFTRNDINKLAGQRIAIDTSNGYFLADLTDYATYKGTGSIYFNKASFDSAGAGEYSGELSGLLEASFPDYTITNGRFDDQQTVDQVEY